MKVEVNNARGNGNNMEFTKWFDGLISFILEEAIELKKTIETTEDVNNVYERLCFLINKEDECRIDTVLCRMMVEKAQKDVTIDKGYWKEQLIKTHRILKDIESDLIKLIY